MESPLTQKGKSLARLLNAQGILAEAKGGLIELSKDLFIVIGLEYYYLSKTNSRQPIFQTKSQLEMLEYLKKALTIKTITQ